MEKIGALSIIGLNRFYSKRQSIFIVIVHFHSKFKSCMSRSFLQKVTVYIGEPMDFTQKLKELRAAGKSDVSYEQYSKTELFFIE